MYKIIWILDQESDWKCTHCEFTTKGQAVRKVFQIIHAAVETVEDYKEGPEAIQEKENIIKKYQSVLHPRHAFLTILRWIVDGKWDRWDSID